MKHYAQRHQWNYKDGWKRYDVCLRCGITVFFAQTYPGDCLPNSLARTMQDKYEIKRAIETSDGQEANEANTIRLALGWSRRFM